MEQRDLNFLRSERERIKERMFLKEMSDNFYYTSGRRDKDLAELRKIEKEIEQCQD